MALCLQGTAVLANAGAVPSFVGHDTACPSILALFRFKMSQLEAWILTAEFGGKVSQISLEWLL